MVACTEHTRIHLSKEKYCNYLLSVIIKTKCRRHTGKGLDVRTAVKEEEFMTAVENSEVLGPMFRCP